jgi:hypothetical protein
MPRGQLRSVLGHVRRLIGPAADQGVTDRQLLRRFADRHEDQAFAVLVERHGPMVLGVCRRVLRHGHDAEDAFQATFLILAQKAAAVSWQESAAGWLYEVARRVATSARRAAARRREAERRLADLRAVGGAGPEEVADEAPSNSTRSWAACPRSTGRRWCSATWRAAPTRRRPGNWAGRWARSRAGWRGRWSDSGVA